MTTVSEGDRCPGRRYVIVQQDWQYGPPTFELRLPGRGTADDWEQGECIGVYDTREEAESARAAASIGKSQSNGRS